MNIVYILVVEIIKVRSVGKRSLSVDMCNYRCNNIFHFLTNDCTQMMSMGPQKSERAPAAKVYPIFMHYFFFFFFFGQFLFS